jgi:hypothetical protein
MFGFTCKHNCIHGLCLMNMFVATQEDTVCGLCRAPQTVFKGVGPMGRFRPENVIDPDADRIPAATAEPEDEIIAVVTRSGNGQLRALGLPTSTGTLTSANLPSPVIDLTQTDDNPRPTRRARMLSNEEATARGLPLTAARNGVPGPWMVRQI